jgi:hypothetical protein
MYEKYKPLRNRMRGFNIEESLLTIWCLSQHIMNNAEPPPIQGAPRGKFKELILPHYLSLLCREILLNGATTPGTRTLSKWADVVSALRAIQDFAAYTSPTAESSFQLELHRIGQQQLPLQRRPSVSRFMRYVSLYESADVAPILQRVTGISAPDYSFMGFMTYTQVSKAPRFMTSVDLAAAGIPATTRDRFFQLASGNLATIRARLQKNQRFDHTWQYTFDSFDDSPLINLDESHPERVYCPMAERSFTRFTEGTFYLLCREKGFDNAFGKAFEAYASHVLRKSCTSSRIQVHEQKPFTIKGNVNHGVDFVLSDASANVFVECKTKRLNLQGRVAPTAEDLDAQLTILADAVVQNYRNIRLAIDGRTEWTLNTSPCVNLVVTLEDWFLVSPDSHSALIKMVQRLLAERELESMFDKVPFAILTAEKFEVFCCAIENKGIDALVSPLFADHRTAWSLAAHLDGGFRDEHAAAAVLMLDEFNEYGSRMTALRPS